jgi:hypothetical protein
VGPVGHRPRLHSAPSTRACRSAVSRSCRSSWSGASSRWSC